MKATQSRIKAGFSVISTRDKAYFRSEKKKAPKSSRFLNAKRNGAAPGGTDFSGRGSVRLDALNPDLTTAALEVADRG